MAAIRLAEGLTGALQTSGTRARLAMFERIMGELESVHGDYLKIFEHVLSRVPQPWEQAAPGFADAVRAAAEALRSLRLVYEPVRIRLRSVAEVLDRAELSAEEKAFATAVAAYFPTGELRTDAEGRDLRTSGSAILDHLYRSLDGSLGGNISVLIRETIKLHRRQWDAICEAYAPIFALLVLAGEGRP